MTSTGERRRRAAVIAMMAACFASAATRNSLADEGGVSFWVPGTYSSLAAEQQQPGWSLAITNYFAALSAGAAVSRAREIARAGYPIGLSATVNASYHEKIDYILVEPTYVFATPLFGGQASLGMSTLVGRDSAALAGSLAGTLSVGGGSVPFARSDNISNAVAGFGDLFPLFTIRWNRGVNNLMVYSTGDIPIGAYDAERLSNLGLGHGAVDAGGAYTYSNPDNGQEFSGTLGFTYNFTNPSTQYQSGVDMHFDWGASRSLTEQLQIGLAGYVYKQIGCDHGSGDPIGCFQSQVAGIGPQIGFSFPIGGMEGYLNLRAYKDFAAENRPGGWNTWVALALSPALGASTKPIITK
jgi:hypothetical protein